MLTQVIAGLKVIETILHAAKPVLIQFAQAALMVASFGDSY